MDELHETLIAYEMRIVNDKFSRNKPTFKEPMENEECFDLEEANCVKKLKRGFGKYKGKLPFNCFNCGKVGHIASKCKLRASNKKKFFYPKEEGYSSNEYEQYTFENEKSLFVAL